MDGINGARRMRVITNDIVETFDVSFIVGTLCFDSDFKNLYFNFGF